MASDKQALTLSWVYGISDVPSNIVNLSDGRNDRVVYAAAHTAIIYDTEGSQTFLQGHCNAITSIVATADRALLVTADAGTRASLVVFWDPVTGHPISTVQQPHAAGVLGMAISADGQQLAMLSAPAGGIEGAMQEISIWDISSMANRGTCSGLQPTSTTAIPAGDVQTCIAFHTTDTAELVTNSAGRVLFWQQQSTRQGLTCYCPPFRPAEFQQNVGAFVASVFVPGTSQALTSTMDGDVVVWEQQCSAAMAVHGLDAPRRRALKIIRLHGGAIHHLSTIGDFVVTGGADGLVRFFDGGMRLCAWFEAINAGPITSVSFGTKDKQTPTATMHMSTLSAPNFMVSTQTGKLLAVQSQSFNTPDPDNPSGTELLVAAPDSCLTRVLAHPLRPELLLLADSCATATTSAGCTTDGHSTKSTSGGQCKQEPTVQQHELVPPQRLLRWDLVTRSCLVSQDLPTEQHAVEMVLARDGSFAVLGCTAGHVVVVKGDSLQQTVCLRNTKHSITRLSVSSDGRFVACSDASGQVLLYGFLLHRWAYCKWDLVGTFKAHFKEVVGLHFGEAPGGQTRLFSLGADQRLVEYDLASCSAANAGLKPLSIRDCVPPGSTGNPCAMCFAPPMPYYSHSSTDTLLLVADDAYKIKAYNPDATSSLATATYLGPTFGDPINKLLPFRSVSDTGSSPWLAYSTAQSIVGLIKWPLDCHPQSSMGLIAHPGEIKGLVLSFDGRKLITLGSHGILNVWEVSTAALLPPSDHMAGTAAAAAAAAMPDSKLDWAQLIGDPALYEELRDYFCYAQLTSQPLDATAGFGIDGHVPVAALPDLMRAAGYYPSVSETDSLFAHVKFLADVAPADDTAVCNASSSGAISQGTASSLQSGPGLPAQIDLDTFLLLYLSHRPVLGISRQEVEAAFETLGASTAAGVLSSSQLVGLLQTGGEPMDNEELQQVLQSLTGADNIEHALPEYIDAHTFMDDILGLAS